jgi:protein CpxP
MKKILVLLAAFSLSLGAVSAQTVTTKVKQKDHKEHAGKTSKTPEQRADHMAQRLTKSLHLTADQTAKVAQAQEMQANRAKYTADASTNATKAARHADMKARRAQYDAQLKQILNPDQYNKYAQLRAERMEKHKQGAGQHKDKLKAKS